MLQAIAQAIGPLVAPIALIVVGGTAITLAVFTELARRERFSPPRRKLPAYDQVSQQIGRVVESGGRVHVSVGPSGIVGEETATTVASVAVMQEIADNATISDKSPITTTADATTLPLMADSIYRKYQLRNATIRFERSSTRLVALDRLTLAAALTSLTRDENVQANVLVGAFAEEVILATEAGQRKGISQTSGSTRIEGVAAAYTGADHTLIGEELFIAQAYLNETPPSALGALAATDILRWATVAVIIVGVLLASIGLVP